MTEEERLLPDPWPKIITYRPSPEAARALYRLTSPQNKRGEATSILNRLLVSEEVREETRRKTIRGALYGGGPGRKRKGPRAAT